MGYASRARERRERAAEGALTLQRTCGPSLQQSGSAAVVAKSTAAETSLVSLGEVAAPETSGVTEVRVAPAARRPSMRMPMALLAMGLALGAPFNPPRNR